MSGITQLTATYNGTVGDPHWSNVLALFNCDAIRFWRPGIYFGDSTYGWVAGQLQDNLSNVSEVFFYHSSTVDGTFQYTGKKAALFAPFSQVISPKNNNVCISILPGGAGPIVFNSAVLSQIPINILGPNQPGQITTNIDLKDGRFLATNGTDFYLFGSISGWTNPNEVYKSTDDGVTWTSLGTLSGATFPVAFGGTTSYGNAIIRRINGRWFMVIANTGFSGGTIGTRVYYTDSVEPVTGWTATTGADIDPTSVNEKLYQTIVYDGVGTHYVSGIRYNYTAGNYYVYVWRSTDNGATWSVDYSYPYNGREITSMSTTNPAIGGRVRLVVVGNFDSYWLEHIIGDPNGTWTTRNYNTPPTAYFTGGIAVTDTYINYLNTGGVSMGSSGALGEGALCYTTDVNSDIIKAPSPFYFYAQYEAQTFLATYRTVFPAYPGAYIDTNFYKWRTLGPGKRRRSTGPGSLRCNGGVTQSNSFTEWNLQDDSWTIEFWMYTSVANQTAAVFNFLSGGGSSYYPFNIGLSNGSLSAYGYNSSLSAAYVFYQVATLPLNTWNFITLQRSGDTMTFYLNGTSIGTVNMPAGTVLYWDTGYAPLNFGAYADGTYPFDGWIDDIRVTKNVARYSGNFQVPWQAFPDYKPYT